MKKKIAYIVLTLALTTSAFLLGKSMPDKENYLNMETVTDFSATEMADALHTGRFRLLLGTLKKEGSEMMKGKYKLRFYNLTGENKGNLHHEEFFETLVEMQMRYKEVFKRDLYSLNPTGWKLINGDYWIIPDSKLTNSDEELKGE